MGLWSLLTGRRKKEAATVDSRRLRRGRFETLEDRRLMDADPLKIGVTYHEEDGGSDLHDDKFEVLATKLHGGSNYKTALPERRCCRRRCRRDHCLRWW